MRYSEIATLKREIKDRLYRRYKYPQLNEVFDKIGQKIDKYILIKRTLNHYFYNKNKKTQKYYDKIAKRTTKLLTIHRKMALGNTMYELK